MQVQEIRERSTREIPVSQLGPALFWLRERAGVPVERLAHVFGVTSNHVRQLLYRVQHAASSSDTRPRTLGVRTIDEAVAPSRNRERHIDALAARIADIRREYTSSGQYLKAAQELLRLRQFAGYPSSHVWLRLIATLHQQRAWFLVHAGHVSRAIAEANLAIEAATEASRHARALGDAKADLTLLADAASVRSHAQLLRQAPHDALTALETVEDASAAAGRPLGSDYYRQRGVALFQLGVDDAAQRYFWKSARVMEDLAETSSQIEIQYTGPRHTYWLTQEWDDAARLAADTSRVFGPKSLHAFVATHWAVACGLSVESDTVRHDALELLHNSAAPSPDFGHQQTIRFLLARTPALGLTLQHRRAWIRHALYVNAFRNR